MFKTKSLTPIKPPLSRKYNHSSLRSLIADKTVRYYHQFQKIVLDDNNLSYSGRKNLRISDNNYVSPVFPSSVQIKQFKLPTKKNDKENVYIEQVTPQNLQKTQKDESYSYISPCKLLNNKSSLSPYSKPMMTPKLQSIQQITPNSPIPIQQKQLMQQMQELIEKHYRELKNKEQKIQDFKIHMQLLEEKIKEFQEQNMKLVENNNMLKQTNQQLILQNTKLNQKNKVYQQNQRNRVKNVVDANINTEMFADDIAILSAHVVALQAKNSRLEKDFIKIQEYIINVIGKLQNDDQSQEINKNQEKGILGKLQKMNLRKQEIHREEVDLFKELNKQIKKNYDEKIANLMRLLSEAETEIKFLLKKLRQASNNSVIQHKRSTQINRASKSVPKKPKQGISQKQNNLPF